MGNLPINTMYVVSRRCPRCESDEFKRVKARSLAFTDDRVCKACGTRYTPPTPAWGRALFAVVGLGFLVGGIALAVAMIQDAAPAYNHIVYAVILGVIGGGVFLYKAFTTK
jgi:uncharacterized protein (DUF983 family)